METHSLAAWYGNEGFNKCTHEVCARFTAGPFSVTESGMTEIHGTGAEGTGSAVCLLLATYIMQGV